MAHLPEKMAQLHMDIRIYYIIAVSGKNDNENINKVFLWKMGISYKNGGAFFDNTPNLRKFGKFPLQDRMKTDIIFICDGWKRFQ